MTFRITMTQDEDDTDSISVVAGDDSFNLEAAANKKTKKAT